MASATPAIISDKVARVGVLLRDKLYEGPPEFRQAYARLLMDEVRITAQEIRISGSKSVLAKCATRVFANLRPKFSLLFRSGAPDTIRTCGLHLRRVALYQAELRVHPNFA